MIFHRFGVLAIAALLLVGGNPRADSLKPAEAKIVDLGAVNGIVYYTVEPTGYRVVATLVPSGLPSGHSPRTFPQALERGAPRCHPRP
jgi:hypothetical protein